MATISIVIPVYNEAANVPLLYAALKTVTAAVPKHAFEFIFIDDGSTDGSAAIVEKLAAEDTRVKFIELSRNFGKEVATSAGLWHAGGAAVTMIDADLQHPVELLPEFIARWEGGAEVVVGVREKNRGEGLVKKLGSFVFYKVMNMFAETQLTARATDYRLLDRVVVDEFKRFTERGRMTRGLIDWMGFKRDYIYFTANSREHGEATGFVQLARLGVTSFLANTLLPLRLTGWLGIIIMFVFGLLGFFILLGKYVFENPVAMSFSGPAQLAILIIFLVGMILAGLGIIALYIANINREVLNRPLFVVRKSNCKR